MPYRVYGNIECFGRRRERLLPRPRMRHAPDVHIAAYHGTLRRRLVQKPRIEQKPDTCFITISEYTPNISEQVAFERFIHNLRI